MDLNLKFIGAVENIKGTDLVPDRIIRAGNFLRAGTVPLYTETDASICIPSATWFKVACIDDMDRENTALHNVLVLKDRVHVPGFLFHASHIDQTLLNLS